MTQSPDEDLLRFLDDDVKDRVIARAKELGGSLRDALNEVVRRGLDDEPFADRPWDTPEYRRAVQEGLEDARAGRLLDWDTEVWPSLQERLKALKERAG